MIRYPALVDGGEGAYGVAFPDIPGLCAMGNTVDEALLNAEAALRDYVTETEVDGEKLAYPSELQTIETPTGSHLVSIPLTRTSGEGVPVGLAPEEEDVA